MGVWPVPDSNVGWIGEPVVIRGVVDVVDSIGMEEGDAEGG